LAPAGGATDKKLTKLAKSVISLRAKEPANKRGGLKATIKDIVEKVTGNASETAQRK
jgi:hypothetical protein